ncbi:MAG: hypothetical protein GX189_00675 [Clostridiales bacterium]|nr:hypothetical protein [Clostridiales bacterium]
MDIAQALEMLKTLADGVNPLTGETLAPTDSCNQPEIICALYCVIREVEKKKVRQKKLPENAGKPWTKEEESILCQMFDAGSSKKELSSYFKRTSGAIAARLVRLGKIQDRYSF